MVKGYVRFLKYFSLLSRDAQIRCTKYLHNCFSGRGKHLFAWFEAVQQSGSYERAWEICFPGKAYRASAAFQMSEQLTKHIETFVAAEMMDERPALKNELLLHFLLRSDDPELFYSSLKEARKKLESLGFRCESYFRQRAEHDSLVQQAKHYRFPTYKARHLKFDEEHLVASQDIYVAMTALMVEMTRMVNRDEPRQLALAAFEVLKTYEHEPVPALLCFLFECMKNPLGLSVEETVRLRDVWYKTSPIIDPLNRGNYYFLVLNVLIARSNAASREELENTLSLYEDIIFHLSVSFQQKHYYNLIRLCIRLAEGSENEADRESFLNRAYHILENYKEKLPETGREEYYLYNRAHLYFAQGNFRALRAQLPEMQVPDIIYESNYRLLWLQNLYELGEEYYRMPVLLASLEQWVAKQKWQTDKQKKQHLNAVSFFRKMVQTSSRNRDRLTILRNDLADTPDCNRRDWLMKKIQDKITAATPEE